MNPTKLLLTATAAAALALPTTALAENASKGPSASKQCKTMRTQMGASTFADTYGTNKNKRNAFGKCVSSQRKAQKADRREAVSECRAERTADADAFAAKYGTGKKQRNAFGKCVSAKAKAAASEDRKEHRSAARECKQERKAEGKSAFAAKYGTNKNKRNAFGKCVSAKVKQAEKEDEGTETEAPASDTTSPGKSAQAKS